MLERALRYFVFGFCAGLKNRLDDLTFLVIESFQIDGLLARVREFGKLQSRIFLNHLWIREGV